MKIVYCGYRDWSMDIYNAVYNDYKDKIDLTLITSKQEFEQYILSGEKPDLIFFIGWSWIIEKMIVDNYTCICLHPSLLPKYRGGSPLQHQIINGETKSAVTFFVMDDKIDQGDIVFQSEFSLVGNLTDINDRINIHGQLGMNIILSSFIKTKKLDRIPQDHSQKTYFKRRKPEDSELKREDFETAEKAYNKIRALQDPYPNAFVVCDDGTQLCIINAYVKENN